MVFFETSEIWRSAASTGIWFAMSDANANAIKRLVIAGGSGFLGSGLIRHLSAVAQSAVVLTRGPARDVGSVRFVAWDAKTIGPWEEELEGASAIVNVVGRSVDCRKTTANKAAILDSRVDSVNVLGQAVKRCSSPPPVWIQSGTAHIYGDTDDQILDESSLVGTGFAPQVGLAWEAALAELALPSVRTVVLRISFVLGRDGGALATLSRLARLGLGGRIGTGRQFISWIHETDLHRIIHRAIVDDSMRGAYVVTAPNPVPNRDFMRLLRRAVHRPWSPPVPAVLVRIGSVILRTDPELALLGRRCVPTRLMHEGFTFQFPNLEGALADLLGGD
jgi:uncharacterized protein (TIGR01777 family)